MLKQTEAGAYMLVLVAMLTVFAILAMMLGITTYEMKVTAAYGNYANTYHMAASGAENILHILNAQFDLRRESLASESIEQQLESMSGQWEYTLSQPDEVYSGEFRSIVRSNEGSNANAGYIKACRESAFAHINNILASSFAETNGRYTTETLIDTGMAKYTVTTEIQPQGSNGQTAYIVTSTARKQNTEAQSTAQGFIQWCDTAGEIILIPTYTWNNVIPFFEYAITTNEEVMQVDDTSTPSTVYANAPEDFGTQIINSSVTLPETVWREDNPALITYSDVSVDVSMLYRNDTPTPSLLIYQGAEQLSLYASDSTKNDFHGIVVSHGGALLSSVDVTGNIFARDIVTLDDSYVSADRDMVFRIRLADRQLEKRLLDYLRITDFASISEQSTGTVNGLLKNAAFGGHSSLEIRVPDSLRLEMVKLKKVTE